MIEKKLGKIGYVKFGFGGYQDCMMGLTLSLEGKGWGVSDFISGFWNSTIECDSHCKWTEQERDDARAKMVARVDKLLVEAKVEDITKLKGIPVEVTFDGMTLKEWRILTEVI